jgi:hypothetical protein
VEAIKLLVLINNSFYHKIKRAEQKIPYCCFKVLLTNLTSSISYYLIARTSRRILGTFQQCGVLPSLPPFLKRKRAKKKQQ